MKKLVQPKVSVFLKSTNQNKPTLNDSATCTNIKNERYKASSKQVLEESTGDSISYSNSEFGVQNGLYRGESNTVECAPTDISPLDSIERTVTTTSLERFTFPKTNTRAFQLGWLDRFQWLEYSVSHDAAYCFVCRQFDVVGSKELAFKVNGFSNWKRALEKNAGFVKHQQAVTHKSAMISWHERKTRIANNNGISELVSNTVLQKRRFYMKTMIEILIFLITNEVAIRGSWDIDNHKEDGVFRNLFEFEISHNKELRKCAEFMPKNATYLSPDIQNELIWTIAKITRQQIVDDVLSADIPYYTILVDGTKDRTNKEIVSMAVRYVKNGQPVESLLCFETITTFDAETNAELILKTLKKYGLDVLYILSQCYDGANVMRGDHGGIQRIIQDKLGKVIPYVHCFNHRLHLVIIAVIENIEMVRIFFDNIKLIYSFFHRAKIQSLYKGSTILNLVVTRWAGHVRATNVVYENYDEIIETLPQVKSHTSYNFDADDIAPSTGILSAMKKPEFVFMPEFMKTFLNTISPADKILQSRDVGFREAVPVIESVMTEIQKLRSLSSFEKMWDKCQPKFDLQARPVREKLYVNCLSGQPMNV
ncbi:Zinc finger MYM-type protein 1 [Pseudolycoriella hygida]|uniref:Zinc finger MYM-type protein 1 n=1 Tax=Pseudolycoriella hygida TaxID=35572 RepID=A0A9Q0S1C9_9DIPT|nr:Zinc finger MYM-type protein 1 [Pseudolycoriella hygida]